MWCLLFINNKASNKMSTQLQNPGRVFLRAKFIRHEGVRLPLNSRPLSQMRGMIQTWRYHPLHPEPGVMFLQVILRNQVMTFKVTQSGLDAAAQGLLWSDVTTPREEHEIGQLPEEEVETKEFPRVKEGQFLQPTRGDSLRSIRTRTSNKIARASISPTGEVVQVLSISETSGDEDPEA
jgi:hypothetical protein